MQLLLLLHNTVEQLIVSPEGDALVVGCSGDDGDAVTEWPSVLPREAYHISHGLSHHITSYQIKTSLYKITTIKRGSYIEIYIETNTKTSKPLVELGSWFTWP